MIYWAWTIVHLYYTLRIMILKSQCCFADSWIQTNSNLIRNFCAPNSGCSDLPCGRSYKWYAKKGARGRRCRQRIDGGKCHCQQRSLGSKNSIKRQKRTRQTILIKITLSTTMMATAAPDSSLKKDIRTALTQVGLKNLEKDVLKKCKLGQ